MTLPVSYVYVAALLVASLTSQSLAAQQQPAGVSFSPPATSSDSVLKIYTLKYLSKKTASDVLQNSGIPARISVDGNTDRLIVFASEADHKRIADTIDKIDRPVTPPLQKMTTMYRLSQARADEVMKLIVNLLPQAELSQRPRMAIDERTNSIVVSADESVHETIKALIEELDRPADAEDGDMDATTPNCTIHVTWLVDGESVKVGPFLDALRPVPDHLADLAKALRERFAIEDARVLTAAASTVTPSLGGQYGAQLFENAGSRVLGNQRRELDVKGTIWMTQDGRYDLEITTRLNAETRLESGQVEQDSTQAKARLSLPSSHPVAFSVSDFAGTPSVIVVEIEQHDESTD